MISPKRMMSKALTDFVLVIENGAGGLQPARPRVSPRQVEQLTHTTILFRLSQSSDRQDIQ